MISDYKSDWKDVQREQINVMIHVHVFYDRNYDLTTHVGVFTVRFVSVSDPELGVDDNINFVDVVVTVLS